MIKDLQDIKNISVSEYLQRRGFIPQKKQNGFEFYLSPFRKESEPSFQVNTRLNKWIDFGGDLKDKGDIIDLVRKFNNCNFKDAVAELTSNTKLYVDYTRVQSIADTATKEKKIKINRVLPISHPALVAYLHQRGITVDTANRFCRELRYHTGDNPQEFFALGFKNVEGGYELRSPIFKAATNKTISLIKDVQQTVSNSNKRQLFMFEGFFDMMSVFERRKYMFNGEHEIIPTDFIVLNSTSQVNKAKPYIDGATSVYTFMDNGKGGDNATKAIKDYCTEKNIACYPMNSEYKGFDDYNKFHVSTKQQQTKQITNKI
jgi:hypothetical protein